MAAPINAAAVAALSSEPMDWRYKGLPASWWGQTPAQITHRAPRLAEEQPVGPICVLRATALSHNLALMADWCRRRGVELAPHGKTHMAPQLLARQFDAGACAVTAATIGQVRLYRAFGVRSVMLANELVDAAGLAWLAAEFASDPDFQVVCWVDSVRGVELMAAALAGSPRPLPVCVEIGMAGGRTGCRGVDAVDEVARAAADCAQLQLIGVAGYEAACGHDTTPEALRTVTDYLSGLRAATIRLAGLFEADEIVVSAGGSTYFDRVADTLTGWPGGLPVRTILRSGCYLTHDEGLYARTSPLGFRPALQVRAQVVSRPEPELAVLTMGRRDVSFDQDLPVPHGLHGSSGSAVTKLNDQHAFLRLGPTDQPHVQVGTWLEFGVSHPCTVFDKWQLIPVVDDDDRVVDLIRTFF